MLQTQINYWAYKEQQRSNLAKEDISRFSALETQTHNRATERQDYYNYLEGIRHNQAQEDIGYQNIGLGYANLAEATRHNRATESIQKTQAQASILQAQAALTNANANQRNASTNARNATTREYEYALSKTNSIYANRVAQTQADLNYSTDILRGAEYANENAQASYNAKRADYYDMEIIRNWVPLINLGGKN